MLLDNPELLSLCHRCRLSLAEFARLETKENEDRLDLVEPRDPEDQSRIEDQTENQAVQAPLARQAQPVKQASQANVATRDRMVLMLKEDRKDYLEHPGHPEARKSDIKIKFTSVYNLKIF